MLYLSKVRRVAITVTFSNEFLDKLDTIIPNRKRSAYLENLALEDFKKKRKSEVSANLKPRLSKPTTKKDSDTFV